VGGGYPELLQVSVVFCQVMVADGESERDYIFVYCLFIQSHNNCVQYNQSILND